MLPFNILVTLTLTAALPATELTSGVVPQYSGVFTQELQCGLWYLFDSCAEGYECIDKRCALVNQDQPEIPVVDAPTTTTRSSTTATTTRSTTTTTTAVLRTPPSCPTNMFWDFSASRCACNDTFYWDRNSNACVRVSSPQPVASAPVSAPVQQPQQSFSSTASFTFYDPTTGGGACAGVRYTQNDFIVAIATDLYAGGSRCGQTVYLSAGGNTVQATVVDLCNMDHGCAAGNIDSTVAVWRALGLNTDLGRTRISYHF